MGQDQYVGRAARLLWAGLVIAAIWAGIRWILPLLAPFLLGGVLAWLMEPVVRLITKWRRISRGWASALCVLGIALLAGAVAALVLWRLWHEFTTLAARLPHLLGELEPLMERVEGWLYRLEVALPTEWKEPAGQAIEGLFEGVLSLPVRIGEWAVKGAAGLVSALPSVGLFLFTAFLAAYFLSAGKPGLNMALKELPPGWRERLHYWQRVVSGTLLNWLRVQGVLLLATFGQLTLALFLLGVEPALLLAGLIALVDALPIFGSGAVLLPWSLVSIVRGELTLGIGLLVLYGLVTLVRSILEPKLVGVRAGLPPLAALLSMYMGFRVFGLAGIILAPVAAVIAWQLWLGRGISNKKGAGIKPPLKADRSEDHC